MSLPEYYSVVDQYSKESHLKVQIACEFNCSSKCQSTYTREIRDVSRTRRRNDGKYICVYCSRTLKYTGRKNPNCRYVFDDDIMSVIDTEGKAYLLGWIASDGNIQKDSVIIQIHEKDEKILYSLRDIVCSSLPIKHNEERGMASLTISSTKFAHDVATHLCVNCGEKKSFNVQFPKLDGDDLKWAFTRGLFDGDGSIRIRTVHRRNPDCSIASCSPNMLNEIKSLASIPSIINHDKISFTGTNALDFMSALYDNTYPQLRLERKYNLYVDWMNTGYEAAFTQDSKYFPLGRFCKTDERAVIPSKAHATDVGYDLTIIKKIKDISPITAMYDTCIKVFPETGFYGRIYPRSSIYKYGYALSNGTGIIDPNFLGSMKVVLTKMDPHLPDLELPFRCAQLIFDKVYHFETEEVYDVDNQTKRGDGGFGSTG